MALHVIAYLVVAAAAAATVEYFHAYAVGRAGPRNRPSRRRRWLAARARPAVVAGLGTFRTAAGALLRPPVASVAAAAALSLALAPGAAAHDVHLTFELEAASARSWTGAVAGDLAGSLETRVSSRRVSGQRWRVRTVWRVGAGEHSFTARLRGVVDLDARRTVMAGRVVSGFLAGSQVRERGRVVDRRGRRLAGQLTVLVPHRRAARPVPAAGAACGDPCVFVWVVRHGEGRVTSSFGDSQGDIDCGTRCQADFASWTHTNVVLTASAAEFAGWKDCPFPAGSRCAIPVDGAVHCVRAFFGADTTAPESAGTCPSSDPGTRDTTPPDTFVSAGPAARTRSRTAVLRFGSTEPGSSFLCRLDARPWRACASPAARRGLGRGRHVFRVAATDAAGNRDLTPATRRWRVVR